MQTNRELLAGKCHHTEQALSSDALQRYLRLVPEWRQDGPCISRTYQFKNYYETMAFINAIAYVIHAEDHHPEIVSTYNRCVVRFDTHSVNGGTGGISENDFICAAKVDAIYQQSFS